MDQETATALVWARLAEIGQDGYTHTLAGVREHPETWSIAVQPHRPDGKPTYDVLGFDVLKETGEVRHMR